MIGSWLCAVNRAQGQARALLHYVAPNVYKPPSKSPPLTCPADHPHHSCLTEGEVAGASIGMTVWGSLISWSHS